MPFRAMFSLHWTSATLERVSEQAYRQTMWLTISQVGQLTQRATAITPLVLLSEAMRMETSCVVASEQDPGVRRSPGRKRPQALS